MNNYQTNYAYEIYNYILEQTDNKKATLDKKLFIKLEDDIKLLFDLISPEIWISKPCLLFGTCKDNCEISLLEAFCYGNISELNKVLGKFEKYNNLMTTINLIYSKHFKP